MGGRKLVAPRTIRPTQDRVRQALFSSLAEQVAGARVLDLFAGSGSLGLEALSRGADWVCWVEQDPRICFLLRETIKRMACDSRRCQVVQKEVFRFLRAPGQCEAYDIVMADPPYEAAARYDWPERLRKALFESPILKPGGIFVMEAFSTAEDAEELTQKNGWRLLRRRDYGATRLDIWVKEI